MRSTNLVCCRTLQGHTGKVSPIARLIVRYELGICRQFWNGHESCKLSTCLLENLREPNWKMDEEEDAFDGKYCKFKYWHLI